MWYFYIQSWYRSDAKSELDIKIKIEMVKIAFATLKHILTNIYLTIKNKN